MRRTPRLLWTVTCVGLSCALTSPVEAQTTVTTSGQSRTVDCGGGTVQITGSRNTIGITGDCQKVDVAGVGNTVTMDRVTRIEVTGTNNRVTWQRAPDGRSAPRISRTGMGNVVSRAPVREQDTLQPVAPAPPAPPAAAPQAAPPPPPPAAPRAAAPRTPPADTRTGSSGTVRAAPAAEDARSGTPARSASPSSPSASDGEIVVQQDKVRDKIDCNGRNVSVLGSDNDLRLRGSCPLVAVTGSDNTIDVDTAERFQLSGDRNRLTWVSVSRGKQPRVVNTGTGNVISRADR